MQPSSPTGSNPPDASNRALKRWGPIAGVIAVVAIGVGLLVVTGGGDDSSSDTTTADSSADTTAPTTAPGDTVAPGDTTVPPGGEITFPLSLAQATEQGIADQVDWGDRCDLERGTLAVPDFFAPDCYAPFTGDNGGATAPGVTADEITVVVYNGIANDPIIAYVTDAIKVQDTNAQQFETMQGMADYFQTFYETYGRKVKLVQYEGTGLATDEVAARADATRIAEELKPFAVVGGPALTSAFADELAARQILCVGCTPGQPQEFYETRDPYVWGIDGSADQKQQLVVEWITKQLVGKNAVHGGDAVKDLPRTFGHVYLESSGASKDLADQLAARMQEAGAPLAEQIPYQLDPATIQQTAIQVITKLKAAGVTTVILSGDPVAPRDFTKEATAQEYFPEWIIPASTLTDTTAFARTYDTEQWRHAFGVSSLNARQTPSTSGYYALYEWFNGVEPPAKDTIGVIVPNLALFFAVLQGTGPELTAQTWRDALFNGVPTPRAIGAPSLSYGDKGIWQGEDYFGIDDATLIWWDPAATGPDEIRKDGTGMYQYVDGGKRYLLGEFGTDDKAFDPNGAVALYTSPPPGEEVPEYPRPGS
jgi:hypothetical protein